MCFSICYTRECVFHVVTCNSEFLCMVTHIGRIFNEVRATNLHSMRPLLSCILHYTVKPVHNDHSRDQVHDGLCQQVVLIQRCMSPSTANVYFHFVTLGNVYFSLLH